jgi:hypothetical protein
MRRVLLAPATVSPKRAAIQAAVEEVAAEREKREAEEKKTRGVKPTLVTPVAKKKSSPSPKASARKSL